MQHASPDAESDGVPVLAQLIVDNLERLADVGYTEGMPPQTPRSSTDGGAATDFASGSLDIEVLRAHAEAFPDPPGLPCLQ